MNKIDVFMNKPVHLDLPILEISKTLSFGIITKNQNMETKKSKICYMDTDNSIAQIKTEDIYLHIGKDIETRLDTSNTELDRQLPRGKSKTVIGLMKNELNGKIVTKFVALRSPNSYSYLIDNSDEYKKAKSTKSE